VKVISDILHIYKTTFSANVSGELVIPESLKLLPVYALGMIKSPALRVAVGERIDRRLHMMHTVLMMPYDRTVTYCYPKMYSMRSETPLKLSKSSIQEQGGMVLLDTTFELLLFVSVNADPVIYFFFFFFFNFFLSGAVGACDGGVGRDGHQCRRSGTASGL
jgi:hypothetical protein